MVKGNLRYLRITSVWHTSRLPQELVNVSLTLGAFKFGGSLPSFRRKIIIHSAQRYLTFVRAPRFPSRFHLLPLTSESCFRQVIFVACTQALTHDILSVLPVPDNALASPSSSVHQTERLSTNKPILDVRQAHYLPD